MSIGPLIGDVFHVRVLDVPRLDLQPVDEAAPQVSDDRHVGIRVQIAVAFKALQQDCQALAEVTGTEVGVTRLGDGLLEQPVGRWIPHTAHRSFTRSG